MRSTVSNLPARNIFNLPIFDIYNLPNQYFNVEYEDSVTVTEHKRHILFNRVCWELFTLYPNTPIISSLTVKSLLDKENYNAETHVKLLERIFKHICKANNLITYEQKEQLLRLVYKAINNIYNIIICGNSGSAFTIDATDFVNVIENEDIKKIHDNIKPLPESIEDSYRKIKKTLLFDLDVNNNFVKAYRSKAINENQANQCIGPRGFVSDIDKTVYKYPVKSGFIRGLNNLYELIVESKTAAKSLYNNENSVKISEYISRRFNLLAMSVFNIEVVDCGSTEYFELLVTPENISSLKGKYYLNKDNTLNMLEGNEEHLINTLIKIRTTLGCKLHNHHKVCSICFGGLSHNFPINSNIGYITTAYLMEKSSQSILSTKHLTHSVKKTIIQLEGIANKYFYTDEENNIYFNTEIDLTNLAIILNSNKLKKLVDVFNTQNRNISLSKIGELEEVYVKRVTDESVECVNISYKDRNSIITKYFLDYIKKHKPASDAKGNFIVYLKDFDKSHAIFHCPLKETNVIGFVNKLASLVETSTKNNNNPYEKLSLVFEHVLGQFKINLAILEILVYATTIKNLYNKDYRMGRNSRHAICVNKQQLFAERDIAALLPFEGQMFILNEINKTENIYRPDHPFSVLFDPNNYLALKNN